MSLTASAGAMTGTTPLLDCFWQLAEVKAEDRLAATNSLLTQLREAQGEFEEIAGKHGHNMMGKADTPCCNDLAYAVNRLCKGVASSNRGARQGFALALTHVLQTFPNVKTSEVVSNIYKATQYSRRSSRDEQRDGMLGRIFGILAVQRAGRIPSLVGITANPRDYDPAFRGIEALLAQKAASKSGQFAVEAADEEEQKDEEEKAPIVHSRPLLSFIADDLLCISTKKAWITDLSYETVSALVVAAGASAWRSELGELVASHIPHDITKWSPEHLSLALSLENALVSWFGEDSMELPHFVGSLRAGLDTARLQRYRWGAEDTSELQAAAHAEIAASSSSKSNAAKHGSDSASVDDAGSEEGADEGTFLPVSQAPLSPALLTSTRSYPQLHSAWGHTFQRFFKQAFRQVSEADMDRYYATGPPEAVTQFAEVWRVYVDELLLPHGPERKATAIALATSLLSTAVQAHPGVLSAILSTHLIRCVAQSMASKKRILHAAAQDFAKSVVAACKGHSTAASVALVALLARGHPDFDRKTHSQTIAALLGELNDQALLRHIAAAQREFARPSAAPVFADIATSITGFSIKEDDTAQNQDEDAPSRPSKLTVADTRRLWALDTVSSALKNSPSIRSEACMSALLSFLAFHAFSDVQLPEGFAEKLTAGRLDATITAITSESSEAQPTKASSKKRSRADAVDRPVLVALLKLHERVHSVLEQGSPSGPALAVLCAEPPMSDYMRRELKSRMTGILKLMTSAKQDKAKEEEASASRVLLPMQISCHQAAAIQGVWDLASQLADSVGEDNLTISVFPSKDDLVLQDDADSEDEDEDDDEEGAKATKEAAETTERSMAEIRALANRASEHLLGVASTGTGNNGARKTCAAYAQLLSTVALSILTENDNGNRQEIARALNDLILASPGLLANVLNSAAPAASQIGAPTPSKKKRTKEAEQADAVYRTLVHGAGAEANAEEQARDIAVFTDASLALLANGPAVLRDCIKAAGKAIFVYGTSECISTMLEVVLEKTEREEDGSDDEHDHDHEGSDDSEDEDDEDGSESEAESKPEPKAKGAQSAKQVESESSSDDEEDGDDKQDSEAGDSEMDKYDQMLAAMIVARKEKKSAARSARQRAVQFKYRALDLLETALQAMSGQVQHRETGKRAIPANKELLQSYVPILHAIRHLANWSRSKSATAAAQATAADSLGLLKRLQTILQPATKVRFTESGVADETLAAELLNVFDAVVAEALDDPNPPLLEGAAAVAALMVRSLRSPTAGALQNPQPEAKHIDHLASGYAEIISRYLTEKHSPLNATFFKAILPTVPALTVRFLPTIAGVLKGDVPVKAFKANECFLYLQTILKAATAKWAHDIPCAVEGADSAVSIHEFLLHVSPSVLSASAAVLSNTTSDADATKAAVRLNAKQLKEVLGTVSHLARSQLIRDGAEAKEISAALDALVSNDKFSSLHGKAQSLLGEVRKSIADNGPAAKPAAKRERDSTAAPSATPGKSVAKSAKKARKE